MFRMNNKAGITSTILGLLILFSSATSCRPEIAQKPLSLIPGECLKDNELSLVKATNEGNIYKFVFKPNMDIQIESLGNTNTSIIWRITPSDRVFHLFGTNSSIVKDEYEHICNSLPNNVFTFYINGVLSLTADKEFMGVPAGENLEPLLYTMYYYDASNEIPRPADFSQKMIPFEAISDISLNLQIRYDIKEYQPINEEVTFSLVYPVRVVNYLTWLNDRLTDENAQMTWKDEVLTCTFSSNVGLRKKTE